MNNVPTSIEEKLYIVFDTNSNKYLKDWIDESPKELTKKFCEHLRPILKNSGHMDSKHTSDQELLILLGYKIRQLMPIKK